jgi:hypothetical protein
MVYSRVIPDEREWLWYRYCLLSLAAGLLEL